MSAKLFLYLGIGLISVLIVVGILKSQTSKPKHGASVKTTNPHPVDQKEALAIATSKVDDLQWGSDLIILNEKTIERDFGWVFFYSSRRYEETHDLNYALLGNGPIVVLRQDGSTQDLPSSVESKRAIDIFEERWRKANSK